MLLPGMKVTILLEEIAALDASFDYDAFYVDIMKLDQFSSGFVAANPNSKIPTLMDYSFEPPLRVHSFDATQILTDAHPLSLYTIFQKSELITHHSISHSFPSSAILRNRCLSLATF